MDCLVVFVFSSCFFVLWLILCVYMGLVFLMCVVFYLSLNVNIDFLTLIVEQISLLSPDTIHT